MSALVDEIARVVADVDFGRASARKRGSHADLPYVPVIEVKSSIGETRTENPARGRAYATRDEAVAAAQRQIEKRRRHLAEQLAEPRFRALREWYGLPRELS